MLEAGEVEGRQYSGAGGSSYGVPTDSYAQPSSGYGAPVSVSGAASYGAPCDSYGKKVNQKIW